MTTTAQTKTNVGSLLSESVWTSLAAIVSIVVGSVFWVFGANFTIMALQWALQAFPINQARVPWYIVPMFFSAIELAAWKAKGLSPRMKTLAVGMTALDMGSTTFGVLLAILVGPTSYFALLNVTAPTMTLYALAVVVAGVVGWSVTLFPERLVLDGVLQIYEVGRAWFVVVRQKKVN